jgi:hypothetical protein
VVEKNATAIKIAERKIEGLAKETLQKRARAAEKDRSGVMILGSVSDSGLRMKPRRQEHADDISPARSGRAANCVIVSEGTRNVF